MIKLFGKKSPVKTASFFDYPSKDKKAIIRKAAQESNKLQLDLIKRYNKRYLYND